MDWMGLVLGIVLGSLVTSVLVWLQLGTVPQEPPPGYLNRVALSVVGTALVAGLVLLLIDNTMTHSMGGSIIWFSSGWLIGGLVAAWFLSNRRRS